MGERVLEKRKCVCERDGSVSIWMEIYYMKVIYKREDKICLCIYEGDNG